MQIPFQLKIIAKNGSRADKKYGRGGMEEGGMEDGGMEDWRTEEWRKEDWKRADWTRGTGRREDGKKGGRKNGGGDFLTGGEKITRRVEMYPSGRDPPVG